MHSAFEEVGGTQTWTVPTIAGEITRAVTPYDWDRGPPRGGVPGMRQGHSRQRPNQAIATPFEKRDSAPLRAL